jgi:flagellar motor switch protein FliN
MSILSAASLNEIVAGCRANGDRVAAAWKQAFGDECEFRVDSYGPQPVERLPDQLQGAGLALAVTVGQESMLILVPEAEQLLPGWCREPNAAQCELLSELCFELGSLWLPSQTPIDDARASYLPDLTQGISRGKLASPAVQIQFQLNRGGHPSASLFLLWPVLNPLAALDASAHFASAAGTGSVSSASGPLAPVRAGGLPSYTRSLLQITVPVTVTLAAQKLPLGRVVELGPGSLLQFEKSCEEQLELEVNGRPVAVGEAVKVGDKFGLRISSMILPEERFLPIGKRS